MFLAKNVGLASRRASMLAAAQSQRDYFSVFEKMKDRLQVPLRHVQSFAEPDGYNHQSQMPEGYRLHGNTAASFSASFTQNSIELHQWHEMESTVHSQFGTVDNPVLIFTSDSSWRIVICMGPGIEDDSHSHEKIYYMVREGPVNRCQVCGQCFKIVRLKDEFSEEQDYYSMMFSTLSHFDVSEEDLAINLTSIWGDRPQATMQTIPATNVYIHVNSDEADRILVDPAYKLEKTREAHDKLYAMHESYRAIDRQMNSQRVRLPMPYGRDNYETWVEIEKSIRKFDRLFNKVEKFAARKFSDPDNFERREKRMVQRRNERLVENYTYYFGGLTEEEQQYRDYFETDLEEDPEEEAWDEEQDLAQMAAEGDMNPQLYEFVETALTTEVHENFDDLIEDKLFKFRHRQFSDAPPLFRERQARVTARFLERAKTRDPAVEADLVDLYQQDAKDQSAAQFALDWTQYKESAKEGTLAKREYMAREGLQQFRDYYEDCAEEQAAFEYLDNLSTRDRIRFMECFTDYSVSPADNKMHAMIKKREFNPELSSFQNLMLDMVDFRHRVRPLANDLALMDTAARYQSHSVDELAQARADFTQEIREFEGPSHAQDGTDITDFENRTPLEEASAQSEIEAAEPDHVAALEAGSEPDKSADEADKKQE